MKYTRGRCGPESTHQFRVLDVLKDDPRSRTAHVFVIADLKRGPRGMKLLAQGRHYDALMPIVRSGNTGQLRAQVRWTSSDTATVTAV